MPLHIKMPITSLQSYIDQISSAPVVDGKVVVYRGHPDADYKLQPAIFRTPVRVEREHILLRDLIAAHPQEFSTDVSALEQLVRMQHYGLPTRLLDVTWNPMVALYFAAEVKYKKVKLDHLTSNGRPRERTIEADGEVIQLTIDEERIKYFDSDAVSCLTNLARCRPEQKQEIRNLLHARDTFTKDKKALFNNETAVRRLIHFIRGEKPAFEAEIEPLQLNELFLVKAKMGNRRILAQEGAFVVFGLKDEILPTGVPGIAVKKFRIRSRYKSKITSQLKLISVNQRTLFPEIDRAARYLTDELSTADLLSRGADPVSGSKRPARS